MENRMSPNNVMIEGILVSTDLKKGSFQKNGVTKETIGGHIVVRVEQQLDGKTVVSDIPVHMFSTKYTHDNRINPSYENIETIMNDYVSIAAVGDVDKADKVTLNGEIKMNEYYGRDERLISFPRVHASFVSRVRGEMNPKATFDITFAVLEKKDELDKQGQRTGRYLVKGAVVQYGNKADVVPFYVTSDSAINFISAYWDEACTVRATGKLNFTSRKETVVKGEVAFGESITQDRTISISDLIITGGSNPIDDETAFKEDEIKAALAKRMELLEKSKNKVKAPATAPPKTTFGVDELGF